LAHLGFLKAFTPAPLFGLLKETKRRQLYSCLIVSCERSFIEFNHIIEMRNVCYQLFFEELDELSNHGNFKMSKMSLNYGIKTCLSLCAQVIDWCFCARVFSCPVGKACLVLFRKVGVIVTRCRLFGGGSPRESRPTQIRHET
jgi:hypothetical protein